MKNELQQYAESRSQGGLEIAKSVEMFRRYAFVEMSCVRALAYWFLQEPDWEVKLRLGYFLFAHAERVFELQGRLEEMRGGHRGVSIEPALELVGEELVQAPDPQSFLAGLSLVVLRLTDAYREHLAAADPSANAMEIRILQRLEQDAEREWRAIGDIRKADTQPKRLEVAEWNLYMEGLIKSAGGLNGCKPRVAGTAHRPVSPRITWPTPIVFNDRLHTADLGTYEEKKTLPLRERCIGEFEVYFNELYAAALLATIIYDSWKLEAPRQYFLDIAHHFWDEVRHAEFGALRLRELGVEPSKINMVLFERSQAMPLLHRLCYLTLGLEVFFMPRKSERARYYEQERDYRSQLFADVDWSEEVNHVRYGKKWIDYFLRDDARSVEDVQAEVSQYLSEYQTATQTSRQAPW